MTTEQQQAMERLREWLTTNIEGKRSPYDMYKHNSFTEDFRTLLAAVPTWVEKPTVPGMYFVLASPGTWNLLTLFPGDESEVSLPVYGPVPGYAQPATEGK